jgi:crossover junction endodeoxyribonuclease RusA
MHWRAKAEITKQLRWLGHVSAHGASGDHVRFKECEVVVSVAYPRRGRADPPNASPTVKAVLDGFTDAGLWADDDSEHIVLTSFQREPEPTGVKGLHRLYITIQGTAETEP